MSEAFEAQPIERRGKPRAAPLASLGSPEGDDVFGTFDARVARRFLAYLGPHLRAFVLAQVAAVLGAAAQICIPLLIGRTVDAVIRHDVGRFQAMLAGVAAAAAAFAAGFFMAEWLSQRIAQRVIFDIRRSMFAHLQDISLSFMDKTHVGRMMARLQGDVSSLQEFLETTTGSIGDFIVLVGIAAVLLSMDLRLGLLTLAVLPALIAVRAVWLPYSKKSFREARDASSAANSALAENINGVRTVQETRREQLNF